jgi:hypothetical protein
VATQEAVPDEPILIKPYSEKVPLSSEIAKFPLIFYKQVGVPPQIAKIMKVKRKDVG